MGEQNSIPSEMRKKVRVEVPGDVRVTDRHANREFGRLVNISEEGLMILTSAAIEENTIFQLSLGLCDRDGASDPIAIGVECLWCNESSTRNRFWAGFYIIDISEQDQERIRRLFG
jgi:hypothetical protein